MTTKEIKIKEAEQYVEERAAKRGKRSPLNDKAIAAMKAADDSYFETLIIKEMSGLAILSVFTEEE